MSEQSSPIATRTSMMHDEAPHVAPPNFAEQAAGHVHAPDTAAVVFDVDDLSVLYGDFRAVRDVTLDVHQHEITAFIGPSGCGKTTVLRCFNRMNDFIESAKVEGTVSYHGVDLYDSGVNATEVRRRIGMVFQKPNPFPKSIYDNVAYGPRLAGVKKRGELDAVVETLTARGGAVGRGEGPPQELRARPLRRSAAAPVHRQGHRRRAGGDPDGRAVLGARSDRHGEDRGADAGDQARSTRSSSSPTTCSRRHG